MSDHRDPRVYLAAERTLLAWIRSGLTVIGLGFVVSRFGLFLRMLRDPPGGHASDVGSAVIGIGLVLLGALAIGISAWQHVQFCRQLAAGEGLPTSRLKWSVAFAVILSAVGLLLAGYLLMRSNGG